MSDGQKPPQTTTWPSLPRLSVSWTLTNDTGLRALAQADALHEHGWLLIEASGP